MEISRTLLNDGMKPDVAIGEIASRIQEPINSERERGKQILRSHLPHCLNGNLNLLLSS
jgi:hypothetical protein